VQHYGCVPGLREWLPQGFPLKFASPCTPNDMSRRSNNGRFQRFENRGNGSRRNQTRMSNRPSDPRGMASTLLPCPSDPPTAVQNTVVFRRILFDVVLNGTTPVAVSTASVFAVMGSSFTVVRLQKLSVWGADATAGVIPPITLGLGQGDLATYTDRGTVGASRASVSVRPSFEQRAVWLPTATTMATLTTSAGVTGSATVEASVEVR
jgi:hypothetical protein